MATYKIFDRADEFRIEIAGRFAGDGVQDVRQEWEQALQGSPRRLSIDISRLAGYDSGGRKLLCDMYRHGTEFAARTPGSLVFLNEISSAPRNEAALITGPVSKPRKKRLEQPLGFAAGQ